MAGQAVAKSASCTAARSWHACRAQLNADRLPSRPRVVVVSRRDCWVPRFKWGPRACLLRFWSKVGRLLVGTVVCRACCAVGGGLQTSAIAAEACRRGCVAALAPERDGDEHDGRSELLSQGSADTMYLPTRIVGCVAIRLICASAHLQVAGIGRLRADVHVGGRAGGCAGRCGRLESAVPGLDPTITLIAFPLPLRLGLPSWDRYLGLLQAVCVGVLSLALRMWGSRFGVVGLIDRVFQPSSVGRPGVRVALSADEA